jgi:hypothetical protein
MLRAKEVKQQQQVTAAAGPRLVCRRRKILPQESSEAGLAIYKASKHVSTLFYMIRHAD